jgi:F-type H+-transporting ATPase subunit delta
MAELTTVARPYAKAAFEFARDAGKLADWSAQLALAAALAGDDEFARYLARPTLTAEQQAEAFLKAAGDKLDGAVRNFVTEIVHNKRIEALPAIAELFEAFRAELEQSADVTVTSAFELSDWRSGHRRLRARQAEQACGHPEFLSLRKRASCLSI